MAVDRVAVRRRLRIGNIEGGAGELAVVQRSQQGFLIDDPAARHVDEMQRLLRPRQHVCVDQMRRFRRRRQCDHQMIGNGKQRLDVIDRQDARGRI